MTVCVQRVSAASVSISGKETASIGKGFLVLLGVAQGDRPEDAIFLAKKCANLRIFDDGDGKMNLSLADVSGKILAVPNFTLCGTWAKGRRPSFSNACEQGLAETLFSLFVEKCKEEGIETETGVFGAAMQIALVNDGPVTLVLDTKGLQQG